MVLVWYINDLIHGVPRSSFRVGPTLVVNKKLLLKTCISPGKSSTGLYKVYTESQANEPIRDRKTSRDIGSNRTGFSSSLVYLGSMKTSFFILLKFLIKKNFLVLRLLYQAFVRFINSKLGKELVDV